MPLGRGLGGLSQITLVSLMAVVGQEKARVLAWD